MYDNRKPSGNLYDEQRGMLTAIATFKRTYNPERN